MKAFDTLLFDFLWVFKKIIVILDLDTEIFWCVALHFLEITFRLQDWAYANIEIHEYSN